MDVRQGIAVIAEAGKTAPTITNTPLDKVETLEIVRERTATAKVFDLGGGLRQARVYSVPIHFHDGNGFRSIDPTVKRKPLADTLCDTHPYEVKSGVYHAHFPEDKPWNYRFEVGEAWVEYEALFDESESLDIVVETGLLGVKETITLKDEKAPTTLSWRVTRSKDAGDIHTIPPTAIDAAGKRVPVWAEEKDGGITVEVDAAGAMFPVGVDPSTNVTVSNYGEVYSSDTTAYAAARDVEVGDVVSTADIIAGQYYDSDSTTYVVVRAFGHFEAIPVCTAVTAASFISNSGSGADCYLYLLTSTYIGTVNVNTFKILDGWQASGAYTGTILNDSWLAVAGANEAVFNAAGRAAILAQSGGTFKMAIIGKDDYDNTTPTGFTYRGFNTSAYLSITYTPPYKGQLFGNTYRQRRV